MPDERRLMIGDAFIDALVQAGILHEPDRISRVIVDIEVGAPPKIYVTRFGDARLIGVFATAGHLLTDGDHA